MVHWFWVYVQTSASDNKGNLILDHENYDFSGILQNRVLWRLSCYISVTKWSNDLEFGLLLNRWHLRSQAPLQASSLSVDDKRCCDGCHSNAKVFCDVYMKILTDRVELLRGTAWRSFQCVWMLKWVQLLFFPGSVVRIFQCLWKVPQEVFVPSRKSGWNSRAGGKSPLGWVKPWKSGFGIRDTAVLIQNPMKK